MSKAEAFDVLILGSGAGGKLLAWHFGHAGKRVAVVERKWIGGSCPNIACLPSKNEIWSAKVAHLVKHAAQFGTMTGSVKIDMVKVRQRKREMVQALVDMHLQKYKSSGTELIMGVGRFVAPKTLEVKLNDGGARTLTGDKVFINVGTHAEIPNIPGLAEAKPLTHVEALEVDYLPSHLIIYGGGYVSLELAQAYHRFGSRVTVIERGPQIMSKEDAEVANEIQKILTDEGIEFLLSTDIVRVQGQSGKKVTVTVKTKSEEKTIEGSDILVAAGRTPNTSGIGLEEADVKLNARGYIYVNERLETSASDVWAVGECAGSPQFTHVSEDDFRIIRDNLEGGNRKTSDRLIPFCLFTDPQLAHVGLREKDAQQQGIKVRIARLPMAAVLRTGTIDEKQGFMKTLVSTSDDRILGFTMIGAEAGEVMAIVQIAILAGAPYTQLRDTIIAHPTMAEGLNSLFAYVPTLTSKVGVLSKN